MFKKAVFLLVLLGFTLPAYADSKLRLEREAPADTYLCSSYVPSISKPFSITVANISQNASDKTMFEDVSLLIKSACQASYYAWEETDFKKGWMPGLRFVLTDYIVIDGLQQDYQAFHTGVLNHMVVITRKALIAMGRSQYDNAPLIWTLGHELGHGVHNNEIKKKTIRASGIVAGIGGAIVSGVSRNPAGVVGSIAVGGAISACGTGLYNLKAERDADVFGVRVLQKMGTPLNLAKQYAIATLKSNTEKEGNICAMGEGSVHPSTADRVRNIEALI